MLILPSRVEYEDLKMKLRDQKPKNVRIDDIVQHFCVAMDPRSVKMGKIPKWLPKVT